MKNDKQQPSFREIDKHLQKCMDRGVKAFLDGLTKYDNDFEPGSLDFDAWASGFSIAENGFKAPLSNETKVVESVEQASYRIVPVKNISWDHNWNPTDANKKEREGFIKGANWHASQSKNTDAVKLITDRISHYGNKGATSRAEENKDFAIWNELNHILKLIQP